MKKIIFVIFGLVLIIFFTSQYQKIKQSFESNKKAESNPYFSFEKAFECHCDQGLVVTPFIKVIGLIKNENLNEQTQKWLLESDQGQSILFIHDTKVCAPFNFNKYDLVQLVGELKYPDSGPVIQKAQYDDSAKKKFGYVQYQGKRYCEQP